MLHFQKPCCAILMLLVIFTCPACSPKSLMVVSSTSKCSISIGMSLLSGSLKVPCPFAFLETKTGNKAKRTHSQNHTQVHVALSRSMCYHHRASYLPELHALSDPSWFEVQVQSSQSILACHCFESFSWIYCSKVHVPAFLQADEKLMNENGGIPQNIKKLATKAKDACERLLKDGSKLIAQADLQGLVKEGYKTLSTHIHEPQQLSDV